MPPEMYQAQTMYISYVSVPDAEKNGLRNFKESARTKIYSNSIKLLIVIMRISIISMGIQILKLLGIMRLMTVKKKMRKK